MYTLPPPGTDEGFVRASASNDAGRPRGPHEGHQSDHEDEDTNDEETPGTPERRDDVGRVRSRYRALPGSEGDVGV